MAKILVVDDSAVDRRLTGSLLEKCDELSPLRQSSPLAIVYANDGKQGWEAVARENPDVILTDLQMPEMNGLELVEKVKIKHPTVPIILMTAHGSEDIAIQALERGAASYVRKKKLASILLETVEGVYSVATTIKDQFRILDQYWMHTESRFLLPNDLDCISPLISCLQDNLRRTHVVAENDLVRVAVALREALSNAIIHGNLEVGSELRESEDRHYHELIEKRRNEEEYRHRNVHVIAEETRSEAVYVVRDEGPGFDYANLPDPHDPANLEKASGRGLLLIRTFMDEVDFNSAGNEITMIKKRGSD